MHRKLKVIALACALSAASGGAFAQGFAFDWNPRSGDAWVDGRLADINQYGAHYRAAFIDEMTRYHGAPRDLVSDLLDQRHWAPGDVYYACAIAQVVGQPCRYVVEAWDRDHDQGWGALAQRLGIQPGSADFHRLKKSFVPSYDHWNRPITIDDDLRADFPGRGKGSDAPEPQSGKDKDNDKQDSNGKHQPADRRDHPGKTSSGKASSGKSDSGKP